MPVYTYRCDNCGHKFDLRQSYTAKPLTRCPECNKNMLKKVISPVGVVFKGSGFYSTDNRSSSGSRRSGKKDAEKSDSKEAPAKTESKAETKAETKTESKSKSENKASATD